ncbi:hypothetical protein EJ08DRAFT_298916 [Tothia fuscella]|uniref:Uncharacterized protein n=1 Tax=Tothia fuscella TaxID=1048955 RepID=A0A9P4TXX6_9PEZI|nr:hypothetical protein EJ08DRAFT_298916 [Tothia fuscella]
MLKLTTFPHCRDTTTQALNSLALPTFIFAYCNSTIPQLITLPRTERSLIMEQHIVSRIPNELLHDILKNAVSFQEWGVSFTSWRGGLPPFALMASLSLTCTRFRTSLLPFLYHTIYLDIGPPSHEISPRLFRRTLKAMPDHRKHCKHLFLNLSCRDPQDQDIQLLDDIVGWLPQVVYFRAAGPTGGLEEPSVDPLMIKAMQSMPRVSKLDFTDSVQIPLLLHICNEDTTPNLRFLRLQDCVFLEGDNLPAFRLSAAMRGKARFASL